MVPVLTLLALALAAAPKAAPAAPWEGPPLQADPSQLARAAAAVVPPADAPIDVLIQEWSYLFDERGRCTETTRIVYRPLSRPAAESWSQISRVWAPWFEERPEIRSRVVSPAGEVHPLDPATLSEAGADDPDESLFSDRRVLRGPLPAAEAGNVVEEVITVRDFAPAFDAGSTYRFVLGSSLPVRHVRLRIESPRGAPLVWRARGGLQGSPRERTEAGRRVLEWDWTDLAPRKRGEGWLPPDAVSSPEIIFSTATSWKAVAARYGELVDRQLEGEDLGAQARELIQPGEPAESAVQKALDWISGRVRYTGLELGESSIVPVKPSETLKRRYGDCKDLALLLAGILRAAGRPATLALVRTGSNEVVPEIPGFGLFDHALVVLAGSRGPLFIDATDPDTPVGALPAADQGRLALVAAPSTRGLVKTPETGPAENRILLAREIVLPETGWAHVVESRELAGGPAAVLRGQRRRRPADRAKADEAEAKLAKDHFVAEEFVGSRYEGIENPRAPVRVRLEADKSHWAVTNDDSAEAIAAPDAVVENLPWPLQPPKREAEGAADKPPARERDFWIPEPFSSELRYRIVPAPGFRVADLPKGERRPLGPFRLESRFVSERDGSVAVTYAFETAKRRLTPAEVSALREGLRDILYRDEPKIRFRRVSAVLLDEGKGREALDEIGRLVALHPAEARHHDHLALALLRLGMTEGARREARRAVELEPKNAWSQRVLASVLAHDALGRYLSPGCDIAGALAAQRRAVELDGSARVRAQLAILLEHDSDCRRFGPGVPLAEAAALLRDVRTRQKVSDFEKEELELLLEQGRFPEALALAREMKPGAERNAALLAGTAVVEGPEAAGREAAQLTPEDRAHALLDANRRLLRLRLYPTAARLLRIASAGATGSAQLQTQSAAVERLGRLVEPARESKDPVVATRRFLWLLAGPGPARAADEMGSRELGRPAPSIGLLMFDRSIRKVRKNTDFPDEVLTDLVGSFVQLRSEGDPASGYRVELGTPAGGPAQTLYLVPERGSLRVVLSEPVFAGLATAARRRLEAGDLAGARRLLGWAREEAGAGGPAESPAAVLGWFWTGSAQAGAEELRATATALEAVGGSTQALAELRQRRSKRAGDSAGRAAAWVMLAGYRSSGQWQELLAIADEILAAEPGSRTAFRAKLQALLELDQGTTLRSSALAQLQIEAGDGDVLRILSQAAMRSGDPEEAGRWLRRLVEAGKATAADYNNLAWCALFQPGFSRESSQEAVEHARLSVQLAEDLAARSLHTLAALHAARNEPAEALEVLRRSVEAGRGEVATQDWLVIGKVAESYGLTEDAAAAYRRVAADPDRGPVSSAALARLWSAQVRR